LCCDVFNWTRPSSKTLKKTRTRESAIRRRLWVRKSVKMVRFPCTDNRNTMTRRRQAQVRLTWSSSTWASDKGTTTTPRIARTKYHIRRRPRVCSRAFCLRVVNSPNTVYIFFFFINPFSAVAIYLYTYVCAHRCCYVTRRQRYYISVVLRQPSVYMYVCDCIRIKPCTHVFRRYYNSMSNAISPSIWELH